ncbi:hypothetical protein RCL1_001487 [Eukaryota sp. TZLM3-RCL]
MLSKMGVWGFDPVEIFYDQEGSLGVIPFVNLNNDAVRCLGTWFGNEHCIVHTLSQEVLKLESALQKIASLVFVPLHLRFYTGTVCFSSNLNHLYRTLLPHISLPIARDFNRVKTDFLATLLGVRASDIKENAFFSAKFGGVGFTKSKIIVESAFVGGMKNFLHNFLKRYPNIWSEFINTSNLEDFRILNDQLSLFNQDQWISLFSASVEYTSIQSRDYPTFVKSVVNLQKKLVGLKENIQFDLLQQKHTDNKQLLSFLREVGSFDTGPNEGRCLITQPPRKYGLWLEDEAWVINMKMRLNLPISIGHLGQKCRCGEKTTLHHVLNCNRFSQYRNIPHNMVRDNLWNMFGNLGLSSKTEVPLKDICPSIGSKERMDVVTTFTEINDLWLDVKTVDLQNYSNCRHSDIESVLAKHEALKHRTYDTLVQQTNTFLSSRRQRSVLFNGFAISLHGRLGPEAKSIFVSVQKLLLKKQKVFDYSLWMNRVIFGLFKGIYRMIASITEKLNSEEVKRRTLVSDIDTRNF